MVLHHLHRYSHAWRFPAEIMSRVASTPQTQISGSCHQTHLELLYANRQVCEATLFARVDRGPSHEGLAARGQRAVDVRLFRQRALALRLRNVLF